MRPVRSRAWGGRSVTLPPWEPATACTIASPRPKDPPRSPAPRTKRSNNVETSSGGMPGPLSETQLDAAVRGRRGRDFDLGSRGGVAQRVLEQVDREAVKLVGGAHHERRVDVE